MGSKIECDFGWVVDGSWVDFWWILAQVGGQVGAKLALKSEKKGYQDDVKKSSKIWSREGQQVAAGSRCAGP